MKETNLSLKNFDTNKKLPSNFAMMRKVVMDNNLKAAVLIAAAKNMNKQGDNKQISDFQNEVSQLIKSNKLPKEAYLKIIERKVKNLSDLIDKMDQKKLSQNNWLKESEQTKLDELKQALEFAMEERDNIIKFGTKIYEEKGQYVPDEAQKNLENTKEAEANVNSKHTGNQNLNKG